MCVSLLGPGPKQNQESTPKSSVPSGPGVLGLWLRPNLEFVYCPEDQWGPVEALKQESDGVCPDLGKTILTDRLGWRHEGAQR